VTPRRRPSVVLVCRPIIFVAESYFFLRGYEGFISSLIFVGQDHAALPVFYIALNRSININIIVRMK
jgi:hypothetical protein